MKKLLIAGLSLTLTACGVGDLAGLDLFGDDPREAPQGQQGQTNFTNLSLDSFCGGEVAEQTFRYGLCVCDDLDLAGELRSSSLRSSTGAAGQAGGVGVNGSFASAGGADIDGSLVVAGDVIPVGDYEIAGELRAGRDLVGAGDVQVAGDAYVAGALSIIGLDVDGTLHTTSAADLFFISAADAVVEDFAIDSPCGCEQALPVASLISEAAANNDNAAAGVDASALSTFAGDAELELGDGHYFLDSINAAGAVRLIVTGEASLFVAGDVDLAGALEVELDDDATLDLFIGGDLSAAGDLHLGSAARPAGVRVYLDDGGDLSVAGALALGGALHAPGATLAAAGELDFVGSLLIGSLAEAGSINVVYDADLADAGEACEPADPSGPATNPPDSSGEEIGEPVDCGASLDCPDPQICVDGACVLFEG
jgi:hypothetical protein